MPREHERISHLVEVVLESASGKREVRISDLSLGGCFVETIAQLGQGEDAKLLVKRPDGEPLAFTGKIAYALQGVGFGMKFDELTDDQRTFLENTVGVPKQGDPPSA